MVLTELTGGSMYHAFLSGALEVINQKAELNRINVVPVPVNIIRSYAIKYKQEYILDQYIWEPFPDGLLDIKDTGKQ